MIYTCGGKNMDGVIREWRIEDKSGLQVCV